MSKTVNMHEAKTHLSRLVDEAAGGADIIIAKAGKPVARLVAVAASSEPRTLGRLAGAVRESADCWESDAEIEALFYGSPVEPSAVRAVAESAKTRRRGRGR